MAGLFGFFNYERPGKGVSENTPEKKGVFLFFEMLGMRYKQIIMLNLLFILTSIPVVTIGPSCAAMTAVLKSIVNKEHAFSASDYFSAFKQYFKKGFLIGIINLLFGFGFVWNFLYFFAGNTLIAEYLQWLFALLIVLLYIVQFFVYNMLVTSKKSVLDMYTDAFILAIAKLPVNLLISALSLVWAVVLAWLYLTSFIPEYATMPISTTLAIISLFSVPCFVTAFYAQSVIKKLR